MRPAGKTSLIAVLAIAMLALTGCSLYRMVVTSQIKDGGRMENPDAYRAGKELVEVSWRQSSDNYYRCFSLRFYQENDMPLLTGWFPSRSGGDEVRKSGTDAFSDPIPWQLTWVQWFELQNTLAESALPAYKKPSADAVDGTDSELRVVWRTEDGEERQSLSGSHAEALETLVLGIAEDAYAASELEAEQHEVRETAVLTGIYWDQRAPSESDCFSFRLKDAPGALREGMGAAFSYRYRTQSGEPVSRTNVPLSPEQAQQALTHIGQALRAQELPAYRPGAYPQDTADSYLAATWSDDDQTFTNLYSGADAGTLFTLLTELAGQAEADYLARPVPEGGWACERCGAPNGSNVFCTECGSRRSAEK